jgi:four helix bundle protein
MSEMAFRFEGLDVWKRAVELAGLVYVLTKKLPHSEQFGLVDQMKRAVVSVPANIAEGSARDSKKDFAHFLNIARGSLFELVSHIEVAVHLNYLAVGDVSGIKNEATEIVKMLSGLRRHILLKRTERRTPRAECCEI